MKFNYILFVCLINFISFAQKSEKIKGSKVVTTTQKDLINFKELELWNKLDVILIKGNTCKLEIEADDNLHETFVIKDIGKKTVISNNRRISGAKKMLLKITYNDSLNTIVLRDDVKVTGIEDIYNDNFTISSYNNSQFKMGLQSKNLSINSYDDSELELNIKSDNVKINALNSSELKCNISSKDVTFNILEKSSLKIEGSSENVKITTKESGSFMGKNYTISNCDIHSKNNSDVVLNCKINLKINAIDDSKIEIYSNPKIIMETFDGEAQLKKKSF